MNDYLNLGLGVVCAATGGELFLRGTVGIACWVRVSPGIIASTVVAFTTSSPELAVAISAALAGKPQISLGDALGSNVVNVALVLAAAITISGIQTPRSSLNRDFPVALLIPVVTLVLLLMECCLELTVCYYLECSSFGLFPLSSKPANNEDQPKKCQERSGECLLQCLALLALPS